MSITNKLTYLEDTKTQIKEAIKAKGVEVSDSDTFRSYASKIGDIQTGGGSGDCVAGVCFDDIGYTTTPQYMVDGVAYALQIKDTWDASATSMEQVFTDDLNLVYFPQVDVSNITNVSFMFNGCALLQYVPSLNISSKLKNMYSMFGGCSSLTEIKNIKDWDVSNVTDMSSLFNRCTALTSLDLSGWNTSNVTNMMFMFKECSSLTSLDASGWDTGNVTNMYGMFYTCSSLTEIKGIENWNTGNVTSMYGMFYTCSSLTSLDLSGWDTGKVTDMYSIFSSCNKLEKIDGVLDLTSCGYESSYAYFFGYGNLNIRKITFKNIGYQSGKTSINFTKLLNWGVNNDTITDAKQSLIDSLVTYTFDRTTAGYSTHTITLSANTKAVLTEEEIAQITAKGYTIA